MEKFSKYFSLWPPAFALLGSRKRPPRSNLSQKKLKISGSEIKKSANRRQRSVRAQASLRAENGERFERESWFALLTEEQAATERKDI
jgi:hypothetical protein